MNKKKKYIFGVASGGLLLVLLVYALFIYGPVYRTEVDVSVIRNPAPEGLIIGTEAAEEAGIRYFMEMPEGNREYIDQERFEDLRRRGARVAGERSTD
jgi:hypothetical protein